MFMIVLIPCMAADVVISLAGVGPVGLVGLVEPVGPVGPVGLVGPVGFVGPVRNSGAVDQWSSFLRRAVDGYQAF